MANMMKAAVIEKAGVIKVKEVPVPEIGENEVLIKIKYTGICGTDWSIYNGWYSADKLPMIPGHEFSGVIATPEKLSFEEGAFIEPVSWVIHAAKAVDARLGSGLGVLHARVAVLRACVPVIIFDDNRKRLQIAKDIGAHHAIPINDVRGSRSQGDETHRGSWS